MSFTCECGCQYFYGGAIQGGRYMDAQPWYMVHCCWCDKKYLYHMDLGFKSYDERFVVLK